MERHIPDPGFAGDTGAADPVVTAALAAHAGDPTDPGAYAVALTALQDAPPGVASGLDRLAQAFPGAELVEEE